MMGIATYFFAALALHNGYSGGGLHCSGGDFHQSWPTESLLYNGTFGFPLTNQDRNDGTFVARGDDPNDVVMDPDNSGAGFVLSKQARKLFDQEKKTYSPTEQFMLAIQVANRVRLNNMANHDLNDMASGHVCNSNKVVGGSPFVSVTLNEATAAFYGAAPPKPSGMVMLGAVANTTAVFPVNGGRLKGVMPAPEHSDALMVLSDNVKPPIGELLVLGGFYFYAQISLETAFKQDPSTYRYLSDLYDSGLSEQMIDIPRKRLTLPKIQFLDAFNKHLKPRFETRLLDLNTPRYFPKNRRSH